MGTPTNPLSGDNPTGQTTPNETSASTGKIDDSVETLRNSVEVMVGEMKNLMTFLKEGADTTATAFEEASASAEDLIDKTGSVRDRLKAIVDVSKKFSQNMTISQATKEVQRMKAEVEQLLKSSKANSQEFRLLQRIQRDLVADEKELVSHQADGNKLLKSNVELAKKLQGSMHNVQDNTLKFATTLNSVNVGKLNKAFLSMSEVLGKSGGRVSDLKRMAQNAHEVKMAREDKTGEHKKNFAKKRADIEEEIARKLGPSFFNAKGEIDQDKFNKSRQARGIAVDALTAGPNGERAGWLDRKLTEKAITGEGGLAGKLMGHAEAGGGSVLEGLIGGGEGMLAKGITKFAGPVGIGLAVADAAKDMVNAIAKQNQELEKDLGKGGLFTAPGVGGAEAMGNARNNLRAYGWNAHNITTERQLAVAQSMQEEGAGLAELARPSGMSPFGGGNARSVGMVGDIVMKQAREVGLTDVEGTKQVMKMLSNYKMTLQGTQDFFRTIGKDIHAAGISTTKYLQLIDDVTDHFGSMGKSIGAVTGLLRMLGSTGTATYDQLKEDTEALTKNDANQEQRSFLYAMQTPGDRDEAAKAQESIAKNASDAFASGLDKAIKDVGIDRGAVYKGINDREAITPAGMMKALDQFKTLLPSGADANIATTQLEGLLKQVQASTMQAEAARSGNAVGQGAITDITGKNMANNVMLQLTAMKQVLSRSGVNYGEAVANPANIDAAHAAAISGISQGLGFDASKIIPLLTATANATGTAYDMLHKGLHPGTFKNADEEEDLYSQYLTKGGGAKEAGKSAKETIQGMSQEQLSVLKDIARKNATAGDSISLLSDTNNPFNRSLLSTNQKSLAEQEKITAGQATATRTLDSLFSELNGNILAWLGKPLGLLVDKFVGPTNVKGDAHTAQVAALQDKTFNDNLDAARKLEAAAEAKGTEWTDVVGDKEGNKRSLKELLATQEKLAKQVNEGGDVSKSTHDQLQTVNEDIRDIVSHATGGKFAGIGPAAQDYMKKMEANKLSTIGVTEDMVLGVKPPDTTHPAATAAGTGVKTDDATKQQPTQIVKGGDTNIHNYGSAAAAQPNTNAKPGSQETVKHVAAPSILTTPPTPTQAQTGR